MEHLLLDHLFVPSDSVGIREVQETRSEIGEGSGLEQLTGLVVTEQVS